MRLSDRPTAQPTDTYGLSTRAVYNQGDVEAGGYVWSDVLHTFSTVPAYLDGATLLLGPYELFPNEIVTFYPPATTSTNHQYGRYYAFCPQGSDGGFKAALTSNGWWESGDSIWYDDGSSKRMDVLYRDHGNEVASFQIPSVASYASIAFGWKQTEDLAYAGKSFSSIDDAVNLYSIWGAPTSGGRIFELRARVSIQGTSCSHGWQGSAQIPGSRPAHAPCRG